jgi:shikimate kinase
VEVVHLLLVASTEGGALGHQLQRHHTAKRAAGVSRQAGMTAGGMLDLTAAAEVGAGTCCEG